MEVPEKEIEANCRRDEKSEPPRIYKHKKLLRTRFEEAMSEEQNSSSSNVSSFGPKELEKVITAAAQPPLPPNPPPPDKPLMIDILKHEIVDDENKCGSTESFTEFNQPEELAAAAPVAATTQSEEGPRVTMCRDFARGTCKKGTACIYAHEIILSQMPGVYIFCKDFQNEGCNRPKCKFVHSTVSEEEDYKKTGYLPPHTISRVEGFSELKPPTPPPHSEEALAMQPTVYYNIPLPALPISCTPEPERSTRDTLILKHDIKEDENKFGSTESLTEFNQEEKIRKPVTITADSEEQPTLKMCRNYVRGLCRLGERCKLKHEIILSQLPGLYDFCNNFQNARCSLRKCKLVHATVFEQQHFYRTGYLPPHTLAHLKESDILTPPHPPPQSEEASVEHPAVYFNVPPPPLSCTPAEEEEVAEDDIKDDKKKFGSTESLTEFNQEEKSEEQPTLTMCRSYVRGLCRLGERCKFEHDIILSQLPGIYTFCRRFQNSVCLLPNCKFVHATVFEQEHFYRTGYLPLYTRTHLKEFSVLQPSPPPPLSEAEQRTVKCYVPAPPSPPISSTPAMAVGYNAECSSNASSLGQNTIKKITTAPPPLPPNQLPNIENKCGSTESLTEFNQQEVLTTTGQSKEQPIVTMCRDYARGTCKKGAACVFKHEIILSQLPQVFTFCRNFQNNEECTLPKCKFVHATVFEKENYYRSGFLPGHTRAHLKATGVVAPLPPVPLPAEASAKQSTVYCNVPPPQLSCAPPVAVGYNAVAIRERSEPDYFRAQPGPSASSQNPEWRGIDEASSSKYDDSAKSQPRHQEIAKFADALRRLDEKRKQRAKINMENEAMDSFISKYNNHVNQENEAAKLARRRRPSH